MDDQEAWATGPEAAASTIQSRLVHACQTRTKVREPVIKLVRKSRPDDHPHCLVGEGHRLPCDHCSHILWTSSSTRDVSGGPPINARRRARTSFGAARYPVRKPGRGWGFFARKSLSPERVMVPCTIDYVVPFFWNSPFRHVQLLFRPGTRPTRIDSNISPMEEPTLAWVVKTFTC